MDMIYCDTHGNFPVSNFVISVTVIQFSVMSDRGRETVSCQCEVNDIIL